MTWYVSAMDLPPVVHHSEVVVCEDGVMCVHHPHQYSPPLAFVFVTRCDG